MDPKLLSWVQVSEPFTAQKRHVGTTWRGRGGGLIVIGRGGGSPSAANLAVITRRILFRNQGSWWYVYRAEKAQDIIKFEQLVNGHISVISEDRGINDAFRENYVANVFLCLVKVVYQILRASLRPTRRQYHNVRFNDQFKSPLIFKRSPRQQSVTASNFLRNL